MKQQTNEQQENKFPLYCEKCKNSFFPALLSATCKECKRLKEKQLR